MVKKKIDNRIRTLIDNCQLTHHRSLVVLIGDHGKEQIVNIHYILSKSNVGVRPNVLWCYKKDLGFTTHRQKRMRKIQRDIKRGLNHGPSGIDDMSNEINTFDLFVGSTDIRYCYYKDTQRILGNTYNMLILQDFASITPNILARTIETVQGGGVVIMLIKSLQSLKQLYTMSMDVHSRYRTEAHHDIVGRFNERFMLSIATAENTVVLDDELNILPISSHIQNITKLDDIDHKSESVELTELKRSLRDTEPIGSLIDKTRTVDQAKALLTFIESISEKTLRSTVTLTAARGRGKSAALGLSICAAVMYGYSNIFVTSPSPENLKTLFEMIFIGFDAVDYKEHIDYEIIQSTDPQLSNVIVRVNIFHSHRQTIQYILPTDYQRLAQAELLVIDEAAAIPLTIVKKLFGNYLVFMSSTINGYEGTGRSLSLKLIKQLRENSVTNTSSTNNNPTQSTNSRVLREIELHEPIRYGVNDPIESWLNQLLCLNCTTNLPRLTGSIPHPSQCELYYVDRDTLFSYHKAAELFLQYMMSLYVSSHYKNTPNDLQLLSDAPAHQLFVLVAPINTADTTEQQQSTGLPDILCVIQVCLEGQISNNSVAKAVNRGQRAAGDLIPWTISQQYQSNTFPQLAGARIVRIAVHPELNRMGYASHAMKLLHDYYSGAIISSIDNNVNLNQYRNTNIVHDDTIQSPASTDSNRTSLSTELIQPRSQLPPLLHTLDDCPPCKLDYIGVSYGLTIELYNYWSKLNYLPVYIRQTNNELTGEHTCIMIHTLQDSIPTWLIEFHTDFCKRFVYLLGFTFHELTSNLALSIVQHNNHNNNNKSISMSSSELELYGITIYDLKRLQSYLNHIIDYHAILDLIPILCSIYFIHQLSHTIQLSYVQQSILLAIGAQHKSIDQLTTEYSLHENIVLVQFYKFVKKFTIYLESVIEQGIRNEINDERNNNNDRSDTTNDSVAGVSDRMLNKYSISLSENDIAQQLTTDHIPQTITLQSTVVPPIDSGMQNTKSHKKHKHKHINGNNKK